VQVASPYRYTALGWYRDKFEEKENKEFQTTVSDQRATQMLLKAALRGP